MGRKLKELPIRTKSDRARLDHGTFYRALSGELHLGYKKGLRAGKWVLRSYDQKGGYTQRIIGFADDVLTADGVGVLSYAQAEARARAAHDEIMDARARAKLAASSIASVVEDYIDAREKRNKHGRDARSRLTKYVIDDEISRVSLDDLSSRNLAEWIERVKANKNLATSTLDRLKNDFKAALNHAISQDVERYGGKAIIVRTSLGADQLASGADADDGKGPVPRECILCDHDLKVLLEIVKRVDEEGEHEGDFYRMTVLKAATGARFSQLARVTVGDLQPEFSRIMLPPSFKGRGKKKRPMIAYALTSDVMREFEKIARGRDHDEPLPPALEKEISSRGDLGEGQSRTLEGNERIWPGLERQGPAALRAIRSAALRIAPHAYRPMFARGLGNSTLDCRLQLHQIGTLTGQCCKDVGNLVAVGAST